MTEKYVSGLDCTVKWYIQTFSTASYSPMSSHQFIQNFSAAHFKFHHITYQLSSREFFPRIGSIFTDRSHGVI